MRCSHGGEGHPCVTGWTGGLRKKSPASCGKHGDERVPGTAGKCLMCLISSGPQAALGGRPPQPHSSKTTSLPISRTTAEVLSGTSCLVPCRQSNFYKFCFHYVSSQEETTFDIISQKIPKCVIKWKYCRAPPAPALLSQHQPSGGLDLHFPDGSDAPRPLSADSIGTWPMTLDP